MKRLFRRSFVKVAVFLNRCRWQFISPTLLAWYLSRYQVISFDVFDTLVFRKCDIPADVFTEIGYEIGIPDFRERRICAEIIARKRTQKPEREVNLRDIYENFPIKLPISLKKAMAIEIAAEKNCIYANLYMLEVFHRLQQRGKILVATSDMYLPEVEIRDILHQLGYKGFWEIFVSNEIGCNKWFGHLQQFVRATTAVPSDKMIHIGDNYRIDIVGTRYVGIDAVWYTGKFR
jgi:predicted HAD superfamily hydrolase